MARKRKVVYPPSRSSKGAPPPRAPQVTPPTVAVIDLNAMKARPGIVPGLRVEVIAGSAIGETGVVESIVGGVIPAALVQLASGRSRRLRLVDLAPARDRAPQEPAAADAGTPPAAD